MPAHPKVCDIDCLFLLHWMTGKPPRCVMWKCNVCCLCALWCGFGTEFGWNELNASCGLFLCEIMFKSTGECNSKRGLVTFAATAASAATSGNYRMLAQLILLMPERQRLPHYSNGRKTLLEGEQTLTHDWDGEETCLQVRWKDSVYCCEIACRTYGWSDLTTSVTHQKLTDWVTSDR